MKRLLAVIYIAICCLNGPITASASEHEYFIICQPDSFVNVRERPRMHSRETGYLFLGDKVLSSGEKRNGFIRCYGLSTEAGEGWVYAGFLVEEAPEIGEWSAMVVSNGRVACRYSVGGDRRKWLKSGSEVTVYAWGEWCATSEGFIKGEYLEIVASTETEKP